MDTVTVTLTVEEFNLIRDALIDTCIATARDRKLTAEVRAMIDQLHELGFTFHKLANPFPPSLGVNNVTVTLTVEEAKHVRNALIDAQTTLLIAVKNNKVLTPEDYAMIRTLHGLGYTFHQLLSAKLGE